MVRIVSLVEVHLQQDVRLLGCVDHLLAALDGNVQRLLDQHMFAGLGGGDTDRLVKMVRCDHRDGVYAGVREHLVIVAVDLASVVLSNPLRALRVDLGDSRKLGHSQI